MAGTTATALRAGRLAYRLTRTAAQPATAPGSQPCRPLRTTNGLLAFRMPTGIAPRKSALTTFRKRAACDLGNVDEGRRGQAGPFPLVSGLPGSPHFVSSLPSESTRVPCASLPLRHISLDSTCDTA